MSKVKIKLLNDGDYTFLEGVKFPVAVDAYEHDWLDLMWK